MKFKGCPICMIATPVDENINIDEYNYCFKCGKPIYVIDADEAEETESN